MVAVCQGATFTLLSDSWLNTPADCVKRTRLEGWQKEQLAKYQQQLVKVISQQLVKVIAARLNLKIKKQNKKPFIIVVVAHNVTESYSP